MQHPSQIRREPAPSSSASAVTAPSRPPSPRARAALGLASRLAVLLTILLALVLPLQSSQSVAFATHTNATPTPTPWSSGGGQPGYYPGIATPTPTLYGYGSYQPAQGQTQYPGSSIQSYPAATGQQSVSPQYPGAPYPGSDPASGGVSAGAIVSGAASPGPSGSDPCYGDELITYSPEAPRIGNEFLIAVTSAHPHPYGRLAGTEPTRFVRERPGQRGYVWEWTVQPSYPGPHEYTFYVDSTVPCQKVQLRVLQSLATSTPKPTKTPTPYNWDNGNGNSNGNNNDNTSTSSVFVYPTTSAYAPVVDPSFYVMPGQDVYNCSSFDSQSNAQRVLRYDPSDPNNLDAEDGSVDGVACSTWVYSQYPTDRDVTPVARTGLTATPTLTLVATTTPTRLPTQTQTPTPTSSAFDPVNYLGQGDRYGCNNFASQANAQAVLRADPTDPNRLDTNPRDGLACGGVEAAADGVPSGIMSPPFDGTRVPR